MEKYKDLATKILPRRAHSLAKYLYMALTFPLVSRKLSAFASDKPEEIFSFITNNFFSFFAPMQVPAEFLKFLSLAVAKKPSVILEIGTARGGTLFCLAKAAAPDALLISIDLPRGKFGGGYGLLQKALYHSFVSGRQKLFLLREDSHSAETFAKVKKIIEKEKSGQPLSLLFIDGDHAYEGVKKDFAMYRSLVGQEEMIGFHDIVPGAPDSAGGVAQFWQETKGAYPHTEIVADWHQGGYGIGVLENKQ